MTITKGTILVASQFAVHRDARFYPDPDRFDPERFTAAGKASRPRYAYFPLEQAAVSVLAKGWLGWKEY